MIISISINQLYFYGAYRHEIELIGGHHGCDKDINFLSVMEVEDFADKCQGNGLMVLTTFSFCKGNEALMASIFQTLIDKGISALIIKINRFIQDVPDALIKLANDTNTPLLVVRKDILFKDIIHDVNSLIINKQFNIISQLNDQHESLYKAILHGENLNSFIKRMGTILNYDCCCLDFNGQLLSQYNLEPNNKQTPNFKEIINEINIETIIKNDIKFFKSSSNDYYLYPCIGKNKLLGFFALKSKRELNDIELILAQQMSSFLSIKLLERQLEMEAKNRMTEAITDEILFNYNPDEFAIKEKLNLLGLTPLDNFYFLVISLNTSVKEDYEINETNSHIHAILSKIRRFSYNSIVKNISNNLFAIITFDNTNKLMNRNVFKKMLDDLESHELIQSKFKIACSVLAKDYRQLPKIYSSTRETLKYGITFSPQKIIYCYEDFLDIRLISNTLYSEEYAEVKNTIIDPLCDYDHKNNSHLMDTLKACIANGTLEGAAREMYIHISTLRYRLEKIHEITGISYFDNKGRYLLTNSYFLFVLEGIK